MSDPTDAPADDDPLDDRTVLATKLHVPRRPPTFVLRERLIERLDQAAPGSVLLVCAPAGCGKSALVADWCHRRQSAVSWLSLDADDNDPSRFWRHVAESLDRADPGGLGGRRSFRAEVERLIGRPGDPSFDDVASVVVNGLDEAADGTDVVLVLEDYHLIESEVVHDGVRLVLDNAPHRLRVVVISRSDPPLLLARRRARGELTEVRAVDLRFDADEAKELLAANGDQLTPEAVSALTDRTEGWAVGLQLAALSLAGRDDVSAFLSTFSGSHRFVLDYLTEEVLDRQSASVRDFLLSTSVLERLSGPLCDALTRGVDGQAMLEACERANLFLIPLDDQRRWWRYHHLFAELLRLQLEQGSPERVPELHRRAATWHEHHGSVDRAIGHAVAAGDPEWAARMIERHADELLFRREGVRLRRHLAELPTATTRRLLLAQARTAAYAGRLREADALIADADAAASASPSGDFEPSLDPTVSPLAELDPTTDLLRAFVAHLRGHDDEASELARRTLAALDDTGSTVGLIAEWYRAVSPWLRGAVAEAEPALVANLERWRMLGDAGRGALTGHYLGHVEMSRADLDGAAATYGRLLTFGSSASPEPPARAVADVGLADVAYRRGDLDGAKRHLATGIEQARQLVYTQVLSNGLATLAWVRRADGDVDGAVTAMDDALEVASDSDVVDLLDPVPVSRARLLLATGDDRPAQQWVEFRGVSADDDPHHPSEPVHLLLARLHIRRGDGELVVPLLDRLLDAATSEGRTGSVIEIEMLRALALADHDRAAATAALRHALTLAAPPGIVRVFADEDGATMSALLGDVVANSSTDDDRLLLEHVADVTRQLDPTDAVAAGARVSPQPLVVPLTERELEVLGLLATGRPNRQIADELYVSLNTVKKHITHILDKLGASNRTEAVDRARSLGLIG